MGADFIIQWLAGVFVSAIVWVYAIVDIIDEWRSHGAYRKQQPLNIITQQTVVADRLKCDSDRFSNKFVSPHPLDNPLWLVYQKLDDPYHMDDPIVKILAWAPEIMEIGGYMLFPPKTLTEHSLKLGEGPPLPEFPAKFGPPTSFRHKSLAGCIFRTPLISGMTDWIWFYRSYYHTGGRISLHRSEAPKVTYWTPADKDPKNLEVHYEITQN
jgi:hypothetical protein